MSNKESKIAGCFTSTFWNVELARFEILQPEIVFELKCSEIVNEQFAEYGARILNVELFLSKILSPYSDVLFTGMSSFTRTL